MTDKPDWRALDTDARIKTVARLLARSPDATATQLAASFDNCTPDVMRHLLRTADPDLILPRKPGRQALAAATLDPIGAEVFAAIERSGHSLHKVSVLSGVNYRTILRSRHGQTASSTGYVLSRLLRAIGARVKVILPNEENTP